MIENFYKSYIAVFTSGSTRAIHLELTPDLTRDGFIRVMKRFMGRTGIPNFILSDKSKTFRDRKVKRYVIARNIVWSTMCHTRAGEVVSSKFV